MRYLIFSDVHANLEALEAVLAAAERAYDRIVCCGDVVGYGPNPNEVLERLMWLHATIVRGNHDKAVGGLESPEDFNEAAQAVTHWTRAALRPSQHTYLKNLPAGPVGLEKNVAQIVHGSIGHEDDYLLEADEAFNDLNAARLPFTFFGHTHVQGMFSLDPKQRLSGYWHGAGRPLPRGPLELDERIRYLINPGSVGQPRDADPRSAFALFDSESRQLEFRRVEYDVASVQKKMRHAQLPEILIERLAYGI